MEREQLGDLAAFLVVAKERSFTRAAAQLGTSQSALSHTIRRLETKLGLRLLTRTTRSVSPTEAGERLLRQVGPRFEEIAVEVAALAELRDKPAGTIRITAGEHSAETILWPALERLLPDYPDIKVEIIVDYGLTDIAAERFDAGVRLGEQVARDMIAVPIGPEMRMAVVGAPAYFARRPVPLTPQELTGHSCINLRGDLWRAVRLGVREGRARGEGARRGAAGVQQHHAAAERGAGRNGPRLCAGGSRPAADRRGAAGPCPGGDRRPPFPGFHLYYPSRRQSSAAFALLVDALRYRG